MRVGGTAPIVTILLDVDPLRRFAHRLAELGRRSGMAVVSLPWEPVERLRRLVDREQRRLRDAQLAAVRPRVRRARGLPSYTEARFAPPARPRPPRREAREPAQLERSVAQRADREPGRRRARSRDFARTGRCSRRPAP